MDSEEHELLRRYLLHRLEAGERDAVRQRHARAVAELVAATGDPRRVDFARALARQAARVS